MKPTVGIKAFPAALPQAAKTPTKPGDGVALLMSKHPAVPANLAAPRVRDIVTKWAADLHAGAPKRSDRDFGEYMNEHLEELIVALGGLPPP